MHIMLRNCIEAMSLFCLVLFNRNCHINMSTADFLNFTALEFQVAENAISLSTEFRNFSAWSSLNALIFISNIHDKYGVLISSVDLAKSKNLNDIFDLIQQKM